MIYPKMIQHPPEPRDVGTLVPGVFYLDILADGTHTALRQREIVQRVSFDKRPPVVETLKITVEATIKPDIQWAMRTDILPPLELEEEATIVDEIIEDLDALAARKAAYALFNDKPITGMEKAHAHPKAQAQDPRS